MSFARYVLDLVHYLCPYDPCMIQLLFHYLEPFRGRSFSETVESPYAIRGG